MLLDQAHPWKRYGKWCSKLTMLIDQRIAGLYLLSVDDYVIVPFCKTGFSVSMSCMCIYIYNHWSVAEPVQQTIHPFNIVKRLHEQSFQHIHQRRSPLKYSLGNFFNINFNNFSCRETFPFCLQMHYIQYSYHGATMPEMNVWMLALSCLWHMCTRGHL